MAAAAATSAVPTPETPETSVSGSGEYTARYVDIGINLTDPVFRGQYHGKQVHDDDLHEGVIARAKEAGCKKLIVTGSDLKESTEALEKIADLHPGYVFSTVGVHPCSCSKFDSPTDLPEKPEDYLAAIRELAIRGKNSGHVVAFGEFGLDYDRLYHCDAETQRKYFAKQLDIAEEVGLPLFLHSRAAADDFEKELLSRMGRLRGGVVHSFTGTVEEMKRLVDAGLYVGINGCSLKTEENLAVVKELPLERLMLETDGPWCEIRPSHASAKLLKENNYAPTLPPAVKKEKFKMGAMVKSRNEPALIGAVANVVALVKGVDAETVCEAAWRNTMDLFWPEESAREKEAEAGKGA